MVIFVLSLSETWVILDEKGRKTPSFSNQPISEISPGQKVMVSKLFVNHDNHCSNETILINVKNCQATIKTKKCLAKGQTWKHTLIVVGEKSSDVKQIFDFLSQEFLDDSDLEVNIPAFMRTFPHDSQAIEKILSLVDNAKIQTD